MTRAVIFDLDDTLYPELGYIKSGFRAAAEYLGKGNIFDELMYLFGEDRLNVFDRLIEKKGLKVTAQELHSVYVAHTPEIELFPDVKDCLENLKSKHIKLGIITDGRPIQQNNKVNALSIRQYFDTLVITDELGIEFRKPHRRAFDIVSELVGAAFDEMCYIGDNPRKDFAVKAEIPIHTVQIIRNGLYGKAEYLNAILPDKKIGTLEGFEF
ncbi:haloacid dehalogenase [Synergistales bacterium]|nr:haloacid dehalogenase [Synergistales bacterium]